VPAPGSAEPIADWQSIAIAAKVLPLLQGQLVVDRIRLQSPHIRLHRDAQGHANWEGLGSRTSSAPGRQAPPEIAGLEIRDGRLDYVDEMSGLRVSLSRLELDMGEWHAGEALPVHARFLLHTRSTPPPGVWVQLDAPELGVRLDPLNIAAPQLAIRVADAQIKGDLNYERSADAHTRARGSLAIHAPSVRKLANELGLNQTLPHDPTTLGPLELTSNWSYTDGALAAKPLAAKLDGVNFLGWLERTAAPRSAWSFELRGDRIDLGRYVKVDSTSAKPFELPLDTLRAINANGSLIFDRAQIADAHMTDLRLRFETAEAKQ
jgi:AsmA protein